MIHEIYCYQCMILKEIDTIFVSLIMRSIAHNFISTSTWKEKEKVLQYTNLKMLFVKWNFHLLKFKDKTFKLFYEENQRNCCAISCGIFLN